MHQMDLRHGDIKLENLLYNSPDDIKFCDFGSISKEVLDFSQIPSSEYYKYEEYFEKHTTQMYRAPEMCDFYRQQVGIRPRAANRSGCEIRRVDDGLRFVHASFLRTPFQGGYETLDH